MEINIYLLISLCNTATLFVSDSLTNTWLLINLALEANYKVDRVS